MYCMSIPSFSCGIGLGERDEAYGVDELRDGVGDIVGGVEGDNVLSLSISAIIVDFSGRAKKVPAKLVT